MSNNVARYFVMPTKAYYAWKDVIPLSEPAAQERCKSLGSELYQVECFEVPPDTKKVDFHRDSLDAPWQVVKCWL